MGDMDKTDETEAYDAYMSVSSQNSWICESIRDRLPDLTFFRPTKPADQVSEVGCMQKCRTIINVISKDYVNDEWCEFELQLAYSQYLFEKKQLIYIELEELTGEESAGLLQYYIECNEAKIHHMPFLHPKEGDTDPAESKAQTTFWNNLNAVIKGQHYKQPKTYKKPVLLAPAIYAPKDYDVVICYCSEDRLWVHNTCLTVLENYYGMKVAVHYRDFPVGESITSVVFDFFQRSNSLLIVLSKNFTESPWCQYELELAYTHFNEKMVITKLDCFLPNFTFSQHVSKILNTCSDVFTIQGGSVDDRIWDKIAEVIYNKNKMNSQLKIGRERPNIACCGINTRRLAWKKNAMMVIVGNSKAGKTSIIQTMVSGLCYKTPSGTRTQLLESTIWKVSSELGITIFDLAGNKCYTPAEPYIINSSKSSFAVVVHNIVSDDYKGTFQKLREVLLHNPHCHDVLLVLAQSDKCSVTLKFNTEKFQKEICKYIKEEKNRLEDRLEKLKNMKVDNLDAIRHVIELYKRLLQKDSCTYVVTCMVQNDSGMKKLQEAIKEIATECSTSFFPEVNQKFSRKLKEFIPIDHNVVRTTEATTDLAAIEGLYDVHPQVMKESGDREPSISPLDCLRILHDSGLVFWFEKCPTAHNMVFTHTAILIDLFRCIFQRGLGQKFEFNQLDTYERGLFNNSKPECKKATRKLYKKGIMHLNILKVLLATVGIHEDNNCIVSLLENLGLCTKISENEVFFPWYVDEYQSEITGKVREMTNITPKHTYLHLTLSGNFSRVIFSLVCIQLVSLYADELNWETVPIAVWKDGMHIEKSRPLLLQFDSEQEIKILVSGDICSVEEHLELWNEVRRIKGKLSEIKMAWANGLSFLYEIDCTHCLIEIANNNQTKSSSVAQRLARKVFSSLASRKVLSTVFSSNELNLLEKEMHMSKAKLATVRKIHLNDVLIMGDLSTYSEHMLHCGEDRFPTALVYPLPSDRDEAQMCLDDLHEYLMKNAFVESKDEHGPEYTGQSEVIAAAMRDNNEEHCDSTASIVSPGRVGIIQISENGGISYLEGQNIYVMYPPSIAKYTDEINIFTEEKPQNIATSIEEEEIISSVITFLPHGATFDEHVLITFPIRVDMVKGDESELHLMYSCTDIDEEPEWINLKQNNTPLKHKDPLFWFVNEGFCYLFTNHFCHVFMTQNSSMVRQSAIFLEMSLHGNIRDGEDKVEVHVGLHCNQCFPRLLHQKPTLGKVLETRQSCIYSDEGDVKIQLKTDEQKWKHSNKIVEREAQLLLDLCNCPNIFAEKFTIHPSSSASIDVNSSICLTATLAQGYRKPFLIEVDEQVIKLSNDQETKSKMVSPTNSFSDEETSFTGPNNQDETKLKMVSLTNSLSELQTPGHRVPVQDDDRPSQMQKYMTTQSMSHYNGYLNRCIPSMVTNAKSMVYNPKLKSISQELCTMLDSNPQNLNIIASEVGDQNANIDKKNLTGSVILYLWQTKCQQNLKTWEELYRLLITLGMQASALKLQELFEKDKLDEKLHSSGINLDEIFMYLVKHKIIEASSKEADELTNISIDPSERFKYLIDRILLPGKFCKIKEFHKILYMYFNTSHQATLNSLVLCYDNITEENTSILHWNL